MFKQEVIAAGVDLSEGTQGSIDWSTFANTTYENAANDQITLEKAVDTATTKSDKEFKL
jgi:hypothetical protein